MTHPMTTTDARERLDGAASFGEVMGRRLVEVRTDDLRALLSDQPLPPRAEIAAAIACDPAYLAEVRDEQQTWLALHLADNIVSLLSDQPHPSVATGQPEQGALLSGWQPIATAPQPWDWMSTHCARFLLARLYQPTDEDGEVAGPAELVWSHVAYMTASGWMLPLQGVTGLHGYGSLPLSGATHWMRLPDDGSGHGTESTTDASRAPGTPNNPSNQTKGGE